jgi:hypothetical protein
MLKKLFFFPSCGVLRIHEFFHSQNKEVCHVWWKLRFSQSKFPLERRCFVKHFVDKTILFLQVDVHSCVERWQYVTQIRTLNGDDTEEDWFPLHVQYSVPDFASYMRCLIWQRSGQWSSV